MHPTGADCSAPEHLPVPNHPHSQHLRNQGGGTSEVTDSDSEARNKTETIDGDVKQARNKTGDESEDIGDGFGGAGLDGIEQGEGTGQQEQGRGSEGTDSEGEGAGRHELNRARGAGCRGIDSYPLSEPRLVEAHDNSAVVQPTCADRSAPQHHPEPNHPHF